MNRHIPPDLLAAVDAKAKACGLSRNRLITQVLEKMVKDEDDWDAGFLQLLAEPVSQREALEIDDTMQAIQESRSRKSPPQL